MAMRIFEGASEVGDIAEALNAAIQNAKDELTFSRYVWRLDSVWGNSSGFVKVNLVAGDSSIIDISLLSPESDQLF
jgi:hypothetical protein